MSKIHRRDFLKLAGLGLASALAPRLASSSALAEKGERPNIIIVLCDALSAAHISLQGYPRLTTPNLDAFARRATAYLNHYSASNFTTSGVASMLTGMETWKHHALNFGGLIDPRYLNVNPYTLLKDDYYRLFFSQNIWPDRLAGQFYEEIDRFLSPASYSMMIPGAVEREFGNDPTLASMSIYEFLLSSQGHSPTGTSLLGYLYKSAYLEKVSQQTNSRYPKGLPEVEMSEGYVIPYRNEWLLDGIYTEISELEKKRAPFFAYFHLYSPHEPYRPRNDYRDLFKDDYQPTPKPQHVYTENVSEEMLLTQRTLYDRQVAQLDDELGKLIAQLDADGILDNSYVIFTSDHGELFERGYVGHGNPLMYEPVIRIPLLIHAPGQTTGQAVTALTSNIDLLPTLLSFAGKEIPAEVDGRILPGFGGSVDADRPIFSLLANENSAFAPITKAALSMRKRNYKLIAYLGYEDLDCVYELYDLENDPEELEDLSARDAVNFKALKDELHENLDAANRLFMQS